MHRQACARLHTFFLSHFERGRERLRREQSGIGVDIGEDDFGARYAHGIRGGEEGERGHDRRLPLLEVEGECGEMQGGGTGIAGDRRGRARCGCEGDLEFLDQRAGGEKVGFQRRRHGGDVVVLDGLPGIGKKALIHPREPGCRFTLPCG